MCDTVAKSTVTIVRSTEAGGRKAASADGQLSKRVGTAYAV